MGLAHFVKSLVGIACLLVSVSIVSGKIVTTLCYFPELIKIYAKFNANECTPVLDIEYAII